MKNICYPTQGTCSKLINVSIDDDNKIHDVSFVGGCMGNTCGVSRLVEGMDATRLLPDCVESHVAISLQAVQISFRLLSKL